MRPLRRGKGSGLDQSGIVVGDEPFLQVQDDAAKPLVVGQLLMESLFKLMDTAFKLGNGRLSHKDLASWDGKIKRRYDAPQLASCRGLTDTRTSYRRNLPKQLAAKIMDICIAVPWEQGWRQTRLASWENQGA